MIIVIVKDGDPQSSTKDKHHELVCPVQVLLSPLILPITKHTTFVTKGKQFLNSIKNNSYSLQQTWTNRKYHYNVYNDEFELYQWYNSTYLDVVQNYATFLVTALYTSRKLYNNIFYPNFSFITNPIFIAHISYNCVIYLRHMNMYLSI